MATINLIPMGNGAADAMPTDATPNKTAEMIYKLATVAAVLLLLGSFATI
jgi:hypothetical protein